MKRLGSCHMKVHVDGLWSLCSMVRSFQATLFHFIVRSFRSFSVKLNVEHACFGFLAQRMRYTPLFLLVVLRLMKGSDYVVVE